LSTADEFTSATGTGLGTLWGMRNQLTALVALLLFILAPTTAEAVRTDWPLQPRPEVIRGFEPPPKRWLPGHRGVDLLGSPGQPVLAPSAGTVVYAGSLAGRGIVVLSHGTGRTTYQPVRASVRAGAVLPAGTVLGRLSAAGSHCAPRACLHWGLLRGREYLDPLTLAGRSPVRLLPLTGGRDRAPIALPRGPAVGVDEPLPAARPDPGGPSSPTASAPARDLPSYLLVGLAALAAVTTGILVGRH
jgi:murein DD-endopeptidase MepM/ murein hydrolase activator NlpD